MSLVDFDYVTEDGFDEVRALSRVEQVTVQRCNVSLDITNQSHYSSQKLLTLCILLQAINETLFCNNNF